MKKILLGIVVLAFLGACNNHDEEEIVNNWTSIATVENPNQSPAFYFRLDNNDRMLVSSTNFPYYIPKDGQRILANYSISTVNNQNALYNHKVSLIDVYEVLTKGIFNITAGTQDSIGNDQLTIRDIWIGSDYLNVEFNYPGYNKTHFINLVSDTAKTYTDNKIHLEIRHNANDDDAAYSKWGIASFKLNSLKLNAPADSVNLVIHTKEFGTSEDKSYNFTYKFGDMASQQQVKKFLIPKDENKIQ